MTHAGMIRALAAPMLLALAAFSAPASAEDLVFTLHNKSSYDIREFYASPSDVGEWEDDILGADVLPSGESVEITIADGREQCSYDLRIVVDDDVTLERAAIDLCELGSFTLND